VAGFSGNRQVQPDGHTYHYQQYQKHNFKGAIATIGRNAEPSFNEIHVTSLTRRHPPMLPTLARAIN